MSASIASHWARTPVLVEPAGHGQALGVVADGQVAQTEPPGGGNHRLDRVPPVAPDGVDVQVANEVVDLDEPREESRGGDLELPRVLAQLGGMTGRPSIA